MAEPVYDDPEGSSGDEYQPPTVDELLQRVLEAANTDPDRIDALFDSHYGYPKDFYVDPSADIIDEEWGFTVSSFVIED